MAAVTLPPRSLPREMPVLRFTKRRLPPSAAPVLVGGRLHVGTLTSRGYAWLYRVFDLEGTQLAEVPSEAKPREWSRLGIEADGTVAVLSADRQIGLRLHVFRDGVEQISKPIGARVEDTAGGLEAPFRAGGRWIVCTRSYWDHNQAFFDIRSATLESIVSGEGRPVAATSRTVVIAAFKGMNARDVVDGVERWSRSAVWSVHPCTAIGGRTAFVEYAADKRNVLHVFDVETGEDLAASWSSEPGLVAMELLGADHTFLLTMRADREKDASRAFVFDMDGALVATGRTGGRLLAFDGSQMIVQLDERRIACGQAMEPGAWSWILPLPEPSPEVHVTAEAGYLCVTAARSRYAWLYAR